ncbi:vesicular glutamate transporter 2-like [Physella acuta]|uniref:vesicular glutamate transporter 2-like n=1 Tax=Physella acuta TaxID=109671 RepID=UPI0027DD76C0|nr:vesicular glutamate transporter 2-like [Physella acuta]
MNIIVFFTYIPVYFSKVLGFDAETTGVLVSVMSTCRLVGALVWTAVINKLMSRDGMTRNKCRKCVAGAGVLLGTSALVCVAVFQTTNRWLTVVLLIVTMVGQCFAAVIIPALPLDMAPRYSGFITGVATSIAGLASIPGPLIVAQLTPTNSPEEWRTVWLTMSALFASGCIIFILLAQATLQPWANDEPKQKSSPHIFAPLASMGRRLSAFIGAPPRVLAMIGQDVGPAQGKNEINLTSEILFSERSLKYLTKKYLKKHNLRDWLRVVASSKEAFELRYFQINQDDEEEEED